VRVQNSGDKEDSIAKEDTRLDAIGLLKSIDEVVFEIISWMFLWPKTLVHVIRHPGGISAYVDDELTKQSDDRFDNMMSPALFFALSIAPAFIFREFLGLEGKTALLVKPIENLISQLTQHTFTPEETFSVTAICYAACPFAFSILTAAAAREELSRSCIRAHFFKQCYCVTPLLLPTSFGWNLFLSAGILPRLCVIAAWMWWFYAESRLLSVEVGWSYARSFALTILGLALEWTTLLSIAIPLLGLRLHYPIG
jgi:hypothetical protein